MTLWCRKHLLPRWNVLAVPGHGRFGIVLNRYYTQGQAVRRAEKLNAQLGPASPDDQIYFKPQKRTCY